MSAARRDPKQLMVEKLVVVNADLSSGDFADY